MSGHWTAMHTTLNPQPCCLTTVHMTYAAYTAVIPYFSGQVMTAVVLGGGALSLLLVLPVRVKYRRHDTDA